MRTMTTLLTLLLLATSAAAQTDPRTLPLADLSKMAPVGTFTYDWPDGAGGDISYGAGAIGVSEDGKFLYLSCVSDHSGLAKLEIPATLGARMRVVAPCLGPRKADIAKVHPDPNAFRPMLGGVLELNGRMTVTGYISYDADGSTKSSHWGGTTLATMSGPFLGTVPPGMVKSQMAPIPPEWRALLGGPALSSAGYTSIISRASYGASVSVFDPADVTRDLFPMTMLLGCPHSVPACITYGSPTSNDYNGSELSGGFFIVPGTRTLVVVEREASGPTCYGYATRNQADHGKPYLDAVYCYSLSDPLDQKGPKGYPYRLVAKLYDLNRLVDVKQGRAKPWDVKQYATLDLPGSSAREFVTSGAYNPVRGEFYLVRGAGGGVNSIDVFRGIAPGQQAPTPVDCAGTWSAWSRVAGSESVCTAGSRSFTESRTFTVTTSPANGGAACPASPQTQPRTEACAPPPPPPPVDVSARVRSFDTATHRLTLQYPAGAPLPSIGGVTVIVNGVRFPGAVVSITPNYYSGTPKTPRVIIEVPGLPFLSATVQVP
jgi:hypothetical protein